MFSSWRQACWGSRLEPAHPWALVGNCCPCTSLFCSSIVCTTNASRSSGNYLHRLVLSTRLISTSLSDSTTDKAKSHTWIRNDSLKQQLYQPWVPGERILLWKLIRNPQYRRDETRAEELKCCPTPRAPANIPCESLRIIPKMSGESWVTNDSATYQMGGKHI